MNFWIQRSRERKLGRQEWISDYIFLRAAREGIRRPRGGRANCQRECRCAKDNSTVIHSCLGGQWYRLRNPLRVRSGRWGRHKPFYDGEVGLRSVRGVVRVARYPFCPNLEPRAGVEPAYAVWARCSTVELPWASKITWSGLRAAMPFWVVMPACPSSHNNQTKI